MLLVQKLCDYNDVFVKFYVNLFYVKKNAFKKVLFQGCNECGLYKLSGSMSVAFSTLNLGMIAFTITLSSLTLLIRSFILSSY